MPPRKVRGTAEARARGVARELQPLRNDTFQHVGRVWFHQRHRAAIGQRLDGARVTRTKDHRQARPQLVQPLGELESVDVGHDDVRKHEVDIRAFFDPLERFAGRHDKRDVASERLEQLARSFGTVGIVVDDEDTCPLGYRVRTFQGIRHRMLRRQPQKLGKYTAFANDRQFCTNMQIT
jgi:hypothetical protein